MLNVKCLLAYQKFNTMPEYVDLVQIGVTRFYVTKRERVAKNLDRSLGMAIYF